MKKTHCHWYRVIKTSIPQQIGFKGVLEEDDGVTIFFSAEKQKILNILNEAKDSKFFTRKWKFVIDNSEVNYGVGNEIIYNTEVLKSQQLVQNK